QLVAVVRDAFEDRVTTSAICGWAECIDAGNFEALLLLVEQDAPEGRPFTVQILEEIKKA
ncbi:MAG: hypothetical protein II064_00850, partial [Bacteroidales bacterium]|nr:hypothetical protein [Bacteroidales bacterium]